MQNPVNVCAICKKSDDNSEDYGEFMKKSEITVHYFCLLLSTNLPQKGQDDSGILGFLLKDIRKEARECAKRTCCYCNKTNASVACFTCKTYFHQICGSNNGCVSEFINEFHSFCHKHVPFQDEKVLKDKLSLCWICHDQLGAFNPTQFIRAYCCSNGYVHRACMRKYALAAGYYLRCLWCNKTDFRDDVRKHGVFVPDREANWDGNNTIRYTDLHYGYSRCDAATCLCPKGREYFVPKWALKVCSVCGASGVHTRCAGNKIIDGKFTCIFCADVLAKTVKPEKPQNHNNDFNYTLFMSKTYEEWEPFSQYQMNTESLQPSTSSAPPKSQHPKERYFLREMFVFGPDNEITGTATIEVPESQAKLDIIESTGEDVVEFTTEDKLVQRIFQDILDEGRELSEDMAEEVMFRMKHILEEELAAEHDTH